MTGDDRTVSNAEILALLRSELPRQLEGCEVVGLTRRPYHYATSFALDELVVQLADCEPLRLLFKNLTRASLLPDAGRNRPSDLHDPGREVDTYRSVLDGADIGAARCYAAMSDAEGGRFWLILELVAGKELWQVGDLDVWADVACWLARFHSRADLRERAKEVPRLLRYGPQLYRRWCDRAVTTHPEDRALRWIATGYDEVIDLLVAQPEAFVHGECYPSNVLIAAGENPLRVCLVDWEMAALGPALLDLAALTSGGWSESEEARIVDTYRTTAGVDDGDSFFNVLWACRLHQCLQWLGWSADWIPPAEHAHDWRTEAVTLAERLGL